MQNFRSFGLKTKKFIITGISETGDIFGRGKWPTLKRWPESKNFTLSTPPKWGVKWPKTMRKSLYAFISLDLEKSLLAKNPHFLSKPPENWS